MGKESIQNNYLLFFVLTHIISIGWTNLAGKEVFISFMSFDLQRDSVSGLNLSQKEVYSRASKVYTLCFHNKIINLKHSYPTRANHMDSLDSHLHTCALSFIEKLCSSFSSQLISNIYQALNFKNF
jgi:hypothetical protein